MVSTLILNQLKKLYPEKAIFSFPKDQPTEIICEVESTSLHPEFSKAVAIIDQSAPHVHYQTTETYTIINGELDLFIDGEKHHLSKGESYEIKPGQVHYAIGRETWVECVSRPGWIKEDHFLVEL